MTDSEFSKDQELSEDRIYEQIGAEGVSRLVRGFYRQIPSDDLLGPMYPVDDLEGAESRLRLFLLFRFGGPQDYLQLRGHPRLRARHAPFFVDQRARDRWMELMERSLRECEFSAPVTEVIRRFLGHVATFLINR